MKLPCTFRIRFELLCDLRSLISLVGFFFPRDTIVTKTDRGLVMGRRGSANGRREDIVVQEGALTSGTTSPVEATGWRQGGHCGRTRSQRWMHVQQ